MGESTRFVWDGTDLIEQEHTDAAGVRHVTTWERRPGGTEPVTQYERVPAGERFFSMVTDAIGTPTELVDEHGRLAWSVRRSLWGRVLPSPGAAATTPLRFPGQYADAESGLHYNVFRYYDPAAARYVSHDPLGLEAGTNPIAYVPDPFASYDPLGLVKPCQAGKDKNDGTTPSGNSNTKHNAGNSGGSSKNPNKRKATDGNGSGSNKKQKPDDRWDRPKFESSTNTKFRNQKKDPANPHHAKTPADKSDTHGRHIISFQLMRDSLKNWVNHQPENLPLGPGAPNSAIGRYVDNFGGVDNAIKDGKSPSDALRDHSGYNSKNSPYDQYVDPIGRAADRTGPDGKGPQYDPYGLERDNLLQDSRDHADFDWPGGDKKGVEYNQWIGVRHEISDIKLHPENYTQAQVDAVIKKFHDLPAPSGQHPSRDEFYTAPPGSSHQLDGQDKPQ